MLFVIEHLLRTPAFGLVDSHLHRVRNLIGIHDHLAVDVTRRAARCLGQRTVVAEESLLVGIEDGHKADLRKVETLTEKVDADQNVIFALSEILKDTYSFECVDITVDVGRRNAPFNKVVVQFLRHALGQCRHERTFTFFNSRLDLFHQIVDLVHRGAYLDFGIEQTRRTDNLLGIHALALHQFIVARSSRDIDRLRSQAFELVELQRPVVDGRRKTEAILHEVELAREVTRVHSADLRESHVALVNDSQEIFREIVEQTEGSCPRFTSVEISRVVFDAVAMADLLDHLQVIGHALAESLGLENLAILTEELDLIAEVYRYLVNRRLRTLLCGHEDVGGVYVELLELRENDAGLWIDCLDFLNLITPEHNPQLNILERELDVDRVTLDTELTRTEFDLSAVVERVDQTSQKCVSRNLLAELDVHDALGEVVRVAHTVDAGDRRYDHDIAAPREQGGHGR